MTTRYKTYATPGSKEARRRSAVLRKEAVTNYCERHGLPMPPAPDDIRKIDAFVFAEAMAAIHEKCAQVRACRKANGQAGQGDSK